MEDFIIEEFKKILNIQVEKLVLFSGDRSTIEGREEWVNFFNYTAGEMMKKLNDKCIEIKNLYPNVDEELLRIKSGNMARDFYLFI